MIRPVLAFLLGLLAELLRSLGALLSWPGRLLSILGMVVAMWAEMASGHDGPLLRHYRGSGWAKKSRQWRKRQLEKE